jgi:S-phase kinase-associated protein 1
MSSSSAAAKDAKAEAPKAADPKAADPKKDAKDVKGLDDDKDASKPLKLVSKDKKEFTVERKQAFISTLVKTSLENDDKADEVPIPGVTGAILDLVVAYMKEHKGVEPPIIEKPLRSKVMKDVCPHKPDADYIDKIGDNRQQLYDLILAANYMDIKSLLHLGCAKVASLIKGQPLEKIKEILDPNQGAKKDAKDGKDGKDGKDAKADPKKDDKDGKDGKSSASSSSSAAAATAAPAKK